MKVGLVLKAKEYLMKLRRVEKYILPITRNSSNKNLPIESERKNKSQLSKLPNR